MRFIAAIFALVVFILVGLDVEIAGAAGVQLAGWGLAGLTLAVVLPETWPVSLNRS